jgi:uncharacterized membrane protein
MPVLVVISRYLHVVAAILAVGGSFFMRVVLPLGLAQADAASRDAVFLRCRRVFKMIFHSCTLLFLLTGTFNTWVNWNDYKLNRPLMHGLWGPHLLLGLIAIVIAFVSLAPKQPPTRHRAMATLTLVLLFSAILCASTLKYVRDHAVKNPPTAALTR